MEPGTGFFSAGQLQNQSRQDFFNCVLSIFRPLPNSGIWTEMLRFCAKHFLYFWPEPAKLLANSVLYEIHFYNFYLSICIKSISKVNDDVPVKLISINVFTITKHRFFVLYFPNNPHTHNQGCIQGGHTAPAPPPRPPFSAYKFLIPQLLKL